MQLAQHHNCFKHWKSSFCGLFLFLFQFAYADITATCSTQLNFGNVMYSSSGSTVQVTVNSAGSYTVSGPAYIYGLVSAAQCRIYSTAGSSVQIIPATAGALGSSSLQVSNFTTNWAANTCTINDNGYCDVSIGATLTLQTNVLGIFNTGFQFTLQ